MRFIIAWERDWVSKSSNDQLLRVRWDFWNQYFKNRFDLILLNLSFSVKMVFLEVVSKKILDFFFSNNIRRTPLYREIYKKASLWNVHGVLFCSSHLKTISWIQSYSRLFGTYLPLQYHYPSKTLFDETMIIPNAIIPKPCLFSKSCESDYLK